MTKQEARDYIYWYRNKVDEYHYTASFTSSRPFIVDYPNEGDKLREAKIVLGTYQWQRPYEQLKEHYPTLTKEKYNEYREKYNLNK